MTDATSTDPSHVLPAVLSDPVGMLSHPAGTLFGLEGEFRRSRRPPDRYTAAVRLVDEQTARRGVPGVGVLSATIGGAAPRE